MKYLSVICPATNDILCQLPIPQSTTNEQVIEFDEKLRNLDIFSVDVEFCVSEDSEPVPPKWYEYKIRYDMQCVEQIDSALDPTAMLNAMVKKYPNATLLEVEYKDERGAFCLQWVPNKEEIVNEGI